MGKSSNSGGKQQDKNGQHHGGSQPKYSPNDDRSIVKNPTSKPYEQDKINQIKQTGGKQCQAGPWCGKRFPHHEAERGR